MENLEIYNALKQPPKEALRRIEGGRLSGKTDINPQWRYKAMTEQFGACGIGWKYEIVRVWSEPANEGQIFAFAEVDVFIRQGEKWSDPIPGYGGSMLVEKEKAGLHSSDEGYKMAITDALSTAMKMLGIAADVYAGLWDGAKYRDAPKAPELKLESKESAPSEGKTPAPSESKIDMAWLKESLEELNWADAGKWLKQHYPEAMGTSVKDRVASLTREHQEEFVKEVQKRLETASSGLFPEDE